MKGRLQFPDPPKDSIQALAVSPSGALLAASAWDSLVYFYSTDCGKLLQTALFDCPALAIAFSSDDQLIVGLSDGRVLQYSTVSTSSKTLYRHGQTVRYVHCGASGVFSCAYDETAVFYDFEAQTTRTAQLPGRPFCACYFQNCYYIALASRMVLQMAPSLEIKNHFESPLRHQTRAICAGPQGLCLASVEGRVAVLDLATLESRYAFRAHKSDVFSYPINALGFIQQQLATAGSDGKIYIWDLQARKKIFKIAESYGISALCVFNDCIYAAKSYNWERLEKGRAGEEIGIVVYKYSDAA